MAEWWVSNIAGCCSGVDVGVETCIVIDYFPAIAFGELGRRREVGCGVVLHDFCHFGTFLL